MHALIDAWGAEGLDRPPYLLSGDETLLDRRDTLVVESLDDVLAHPDFDFTRSRQVHLGLLPVPFAGDLERSEVFLLLLNPGFKAADYFSEFNNPSFAAAIRGNLKQKPVDPKYPMIYLNPAFADTGGYLYWRHKLAGLLDRARLQHGWTLTQALSYFSQKIAVLEMFPYHSATFGLSPRVLSGLNSVRLMRDFVGDIVRPRARARDATIVITRQANYWGLEPDRNIVVYSGAATRSAHLSLESLGGRAIAQQLGLTVSV
jgi:hypothetical protein